MSLPEYDMYYSTGILV